METKLNDIIDIMTEVFGQGEQEGTSVKWTVDNKDMFLYDNTDIVIYGTMSDENEYYLNEICDIYGLYVERITHLEFEDESELIF